MGKNERNNQCNKKDNSSQVVEKPKFDKKKWRERKYSIKFKVDAWQKKREKDRLRQYYNELKKDPQYSQQIKDKLAQTNSARQTAEDDLNTSTAADFKAQSSYKNRRKLNSYEAARAEMKRIKEERQRQREEELQRKEEINERMEEYKKKRSERYKILSRKNNKGQPEMKGRLQLLYEQIKQSVSTG